MKILHVFKTYVPDTYGGTQRVIFELARGTVRAGHTAEVLYLSKASSGTRTRVDNHWAHSAHLDIEIASTGFSLSAFSLFRKLATEADLVHLHFPWPFMDVVHFLTRIGKPTVVTYHSDILRQRWLLASASWASIG